MSELRLDPELVPCFQWVHALSRVAASDDGPIDIEDPYVLDHELDGSDISLHLGGGWGSFGSSIDGPQVWIGTAGASSAPSMVERISATNLRTSGYVNAKPAGGVLFTSSAGRWGFGLWGMYLLLGSSRSLLPPPYPWWRLEPDVSARIYEVATAVEWVRLLTRYGRQVGGAVLPDWVRIADDFDGVHVTPTGVSATQGIRFLSDLGATAPAYWDVDTTVWFRWRFTSAHHEGTLPAT